MVSATGPMLRSPPNTLISREIYMQRDGLVTTIDNFSQINTFATSIFFLTKYNQNASSIFPDNGLGSDHLHCRCQVQNSQTTSPLLANPAAPS